MIPAQAAAGLAAWDTMDSVLGITRLDESAVPAEIQSLLEQRQAARKARDFQRADAIRDELKTQGWAIEDTAKGARLKRQ
jgi:cysteinyl-tRNA synthetase